MLKGFLGSWQWCCQKKNKMTKKTIRRKEDIGSYGNYEQSDFFDLVKEIKDRTDPILRDLQNKNKSNIIVRYEMADSYDITYLNICIEYDDIETDAEYQSRLKAEENYKQAEIKRAKEILNKYSQK